LYDSVKALLRWLPRTHEPAYDFLDAYSRQRRRQVSFIQIGANDGLRNDPFREFIIRDCWSGILIEPLPTVFEMLKRNYAHASQRLVFVNAAITDSDNQTLTFYGFDESFLKTLPLEKRLGYTRKASFNREHVEQYVEVDERWSIKETPVRCLRLEDVIATHWQGGPIDLLAIDAEGHEPAIIRSIDFRGFRPQVVFFESHTLGSERTPLLEYLKAEGYRLFDIVGDSVAILPETLTALGEVHMLRPA